MSDKAVREGAPSISDLTRAIERAVNIMRGGPLIADTLLSPAARLHDAVNVLEAALKEGASREAVPSKSLAREKLSELRELIRAGEMPEYGNLPQTDLASRSYVILAEAVDLAWDAVEREEAEREAVPSDSSKEKSNG